MGGDRQSHFCLFYWGEGCVLDSTMWKGVHRCEGSWREADQLVIGKHKKEHKMAGVDLLFEKEESQSDSQRKLKKMTNEFSVERCRTLHK